MATKSEKPADTPAPINKKSEVRKVEQALLTAIKHDVDTLAKRFLGDSTATSTSASMNYSLKRFGQIFNEMEFSTIFLGHLSFADLVEFSENLFHYVGYYLFGPLINRSLPDYIQMPEKQNEATKNKISQMFPGPDRRTDQERIFGIFLAYSLYFMQPTQFVIPVFATKLQLDDLYEFMATVLLPEEKFEALYCLHRLIQSNAFAIYPFDGKFNPVLHRHFTLFDVDQPAEQQQLENLAEFDQLRSIAHEYTVQQLEKLHLLYMEAKRENATMLPQSALVPREGPSELLNRLIRETETTLRNKRARNAEE